MVLAVAAAAPVSTARRVNSLMSNLPAFPAVASGLFLDRAYAGPAARHLDLADDLKLFAVEAQHIKRFVEHGLGEQGLAVLAPHHSLAPAADLGLRSQRELRALDAVHHDEAVVVVGLMRLGPLRAVLDRDRH